MTREEAKKILSEYVRACNEDDFPTLETFEYEEVIEAMAMGAKALSKPSLPTNLDEAAELSANDAVIKRQFPSVVYNTHLKCFNHSDLIKQFKAGAKYCIENLS